MKIENSDVVMKSKFQSQEIHYSSIETVEVKHDFLSIVEENSYKAKVATEQLLGTDFQSKKAQPSNTIYSCENQLYSKEQLNKQIIDNIIGSFFNTENDQLKHSSISIETKEEYYKKQTVDFSTSLEIQTPNNNYKIDLEVAFSQELYEAHNMQLQFGNTNIIDPLVINYGDESNPFDNISKLKFEFDINNDGEDDLIPLLKEGSGFLAYDKNNNGEIDNGSELFGPQTNDGFSELATYDQDKNNWIDENDSVFNKLKVWQIDDTGENKLVSLVDLNVGAIYLGEVQSGFSYQNKIDKIDAIQRTNGIYVKNDGSGVRMINALDMALETKI